MQVQVDNILYQDVKTASRFIGIDENELLNRALMLYLNSIQQTAALNQELQAWDLLSDEALIGMENTIQNDYAKRRNLDSKNSRVARP